MSRPRSPSAKRWSSAIALVGVTLVLPGVLLEAALFFLDDRYERNFQVPPVRPEDFRERAGAFFESESFDAELGWDYRPPVQNHEEGKTFLAQAYGDSFVRSGAGGTTWQSAFESLTGEAILNLGVGGYGLDQAVLKFEKYGSAYPTRIAILGLFREAYRRALSYHARYYFYVHEPFEFAFKPIFVKNGADYVLYGPPCANAPCLWDVLYEPDNGARAVRATHDHWYRKNLEKPVLRFPRLPKYARALPELWRNSKWKRAEVNHHFVNDRSLELSKYLVERFAEHAEAQGMVPVCLLLYSASDLVVLKNGPRHDQALLDFLEARHLRYVDTAKHIRERYSEEDDFASLSVPDGHLNDRGDQLVAAALAQGLAEMGLIEASGSR